MLDYGRTRKTFGTTINRHGQIQRYITEGYAMTEAAKAIVYNEALTTRCDRHGNRIGTGNALRGSHC